MTLSYTRNKYASTTDLEDGSLLVRAIMQDTFFSGTVELKVSVPELNVTSIDGRIERAFDNGCQEAVPLLQKIVGLNIGTGIIKAVNGLVGGSGGCPKLADLVLECVDEVVLRFTLPSVRERQKKSEQERLEATKEMVRQNPRLIGSCIAFAKDSPLLKGLEQQEES